MHVRMMPTLLVQMHIDGKMVGLFRALGDTGSEAELIHQNTVTQWLHLAQPAQVNIVGLGDQDVPVRKKIQVELRPWYAQDNRVTLSVTLWILPKAHNWGPTYPNQPISPDAISQNLKGPLANPYFWKPSQMQILLGIEVLAMLMMNGQTQRVGNRVISQQTAMGNVLFGKAGDWIYSDSPRLTVNQTVHVVNMQELDKNIQKFWQFEDLALCTKKDADNELVEQMFAQTHYRTDSGRHVVALPMNPKVKELGSSREIALRRFLMQERKFDRDPEYKKKYIEFMDEMIELGHMQEAKSAPKPGEMVYHIPHHGIMPSPERFRVVFDASCPTNLGVSLNSAQFVGPRLQRDLSDILMRFRRHRLAVSADIKKMFRQVELVPAQWNLQRIFWRRDKSKPLKEYQLVTVIYGLAASPYLAVKALLEGAAEHESVYPLAVHAIKNDFYVDDCVTGAETERQAIELAREIQMILKKSGFILDKWRSNSLKILKEFGSKDMSPILFEDLEQTSILGVKWQPNSDHYTFKVNKGSVTDKMTKRIILSKISQLFDPNGYVAPTVVLGKMLMQQIWATKLNWDDAVPQHILNQWNSFWARISNLENVKIPRWIGMATGVKLQLHGFADSSIQAYGCSIYLRAVHLDGSITCRLIASKSRVAPLKTVTIPRLELAATELLSQLLSSVRESMELQTVPYVLWTDNTIALHWINKPLHVLKLYVSNRVKKIQELTDVKCWRHIRTHENPADLISRGMQADELVNNKLWWHGPQWLTEPEKQWPPPVEITQLKQPNEVRTELKVQVASVQSKELEIFVHNHTKKVYLFDYTKNLGEMKRILTYVLRFVDNWVKCVKEKKKPPQNQISAVELSQNLRKYVPFPTEEEQIRAIKIFIRREQILAYPREYAHFKKYGNSNPHAFPEKSKLSNLHPQFSDDNLIRVGGRIGKAELPYDTRHPIVVPPHSRLSRALILEAHRKTNHGGTQLMIQYIRATYWIPKLRSEIKNFSQKCTECVRHAHKPASQLMADLPADRIRQYKPFRNTGVDYAGPFMLKESNKRNAKSQKCWFAIFVCMCTRAVHIDIVTDYSSAAFIACYERFIARRGKCTHMYSDNGTTFVGAYKEIKSAFMNWSSPENVEHLNRQGTKWTFMKPASPHQGGIYEAAVKSAKHHLVRVIGAQKYTYEQYLTLLCQVEAVLNSRPLYAPSDDPLDAPVITPGHFLIGEEFVSPPPINAPPQSDYSLQRVRKEQQKMLKSFWESWSADYLTSLIPRKKWKKVEKNVEIGQVVLVNDNNLPPSQWLIGKIVQILPSHDNLVRSVVIEVASKKHTSGKYVKKTSKLTRAVQKICILPTEAEIDIILPDIDESDKEVCDLSQEISVQKEQVPNKPVVRTISTRSKAKL